MLELAALTAFYIGCVLLYAAHPRRLARAPLRFGCLSGRMHRALALIWVANGVGLWARAHGWAEALLVTVPALSAIASLCVLAAPVWPRIVWGAVLCVHPLCLALALLGVANG